MVSRKGPGSRPKGRAGFCGGGSCIIGGQGRKKIAVETVPVEHQVTSSQADADVGTIKLIGSEIRRPAQVAGNLLAGGRDNLRHPRAPAVDWTKPSKRLSWRITEYMKSGSNPFCWAAGRTIFW